MMKLIRRFVGSIVFTMIFILVLSFSTFCDWINDGQGFKYLNGATNQYVINNWLQTGTGYYFLDQNGYIVKGWYLINGKYYYFNNDGLMQTGFQEINGKRYYLDPQNGQMVTGWIQVYNNGVLDYYYFDENGAMVTGWKQIGTKWYYFDQGKALVGTWAKINDIWYHLNETGAMDTGWITCNNKMYHLNVSNGSLTKGWIQDQYGTEYYLSEVDGSLATNCTININGINCSFDELGKCIAKNQYTGTVTGNALNGGFLNSATNKGQVAAYGVNVGISPGQNVIQGAVTSSQQQIQNNTLEAGATSGPQ